MTASDRLLVMAGLGSWVLAALSLSLLGWSFHAAFEIPTSLSNLLLIGALMLGLISTVMLFSRLARQGLLSLPLLSGFAGATLLAAFALVAAVKAVH